MRKGSLPQIFWLQCRDAGILIDTNLLIVLLIGLYNPEYIQNFKRTKSYSKDDFLLLLGYVKRFNKIHVTPYILAETSNFSFEIASEKLREYIKIFVAEVLSHHETYCHKDILIKSEFFPKFGMTDTSIAQLAKKEKCLVITDDFKLSNSLALKNLFVLNFTNVRGAQFLNSV